MRFLGHLVIFTTATLQLTAAISIDGIRPTSSGASFAFRVSDVVSCSVRIFDGNGLLVDDTNYFLFPNAQYCGRPGSSIAGNQVTFNAGGGGTLVALDGQYHSRNLLAGRMYRYEIRSGADVTTGTFTTTFSLMTSTLPSSGPAFSYYNGTVSSCSLVYGFPVPALCTAPGELPLGTFPVPAPGGFYTDPNFGSPVRPLTGPGTYKHAYSTPTPISTSGRYTLISDSTFATILDTATALPVRQKARAYRSWSSGEIVWDPTSDDVFYYFSAYWNGSAVVADRLMRFQVSTGTETIVQDYSKPPYNFTNVFRGGTGDMSKDGWLPFLTNTQAVCVVKVFSGQTFCADYGSTGGLGWTMVDFVSISKGPDRATGMHYLIVQGSPANAVFQFDSTRGTITFQFRPEMPAALAGRGNGNGICEAGESCMGQAHSDTMEDPTGIQYLVRTVQLSSPCSQVLTAIRLSAGIRMLQSEAEGGGRRDIATLSLCGGPRWPSVHVGCARRSSFCAVSIENVPKNLPTEIRDGAPYNGEIWVTRGAGLEVRRLAMHRSVIQKYYDQPRVAISDFGDKVVWDSNFGTTQSRVVLAETGLR